MHAPSSGYILMLKTEGFLAFVRSQIRESCCHARYVARLLDLPLKARVCMEILKARAWGTARLRCTLLLQREQGCCCPLPFAWLFGQARATGSSNAPDIRSKGNRHGRACKSLTDGSAQLSATVKSGGRRPLRFLFPAGFARRIATRSCLSQTPQPMSRFKTVLPRTEDAALVQDLILRVVDAEHRVETEALAALENSVATGDAMCFKSPERLRMEEMLGYRDSDMLITQWKELRNRWDDLESMHELIREQVTNSSIQVSDATRRPTSGSKDLCLSLNANLDKAYKELEAMETRLEAMEKDVVLQMGLIEKERRLSNQRNARRRTMANPCTMDCALIELVPALGFADAELLAKDLYHLYTTYAAIKEWSLTPLGSGCTPGLSSSYGTESILFEIEGCQAYERLQSEAGLHRFFHMSQCTEKVLKMQKIYTSTVLVTVLPPADPIEDQLHEDDLQITYTSYGGPGGSQGTVATSGVSVLHKPTGFHVTCRETRSGKQNLSRALRILESKVQAEEQRKRDDALSSSISAILKTKEPAERIRTYDYLNGKVTDHRSKITLNTLTALMETGEGFDALVESYHTLRHSEMALVLGQRLRRCMSGVARLQRHENLERKVSPRTIDR